MQGEGMKKGPQSGPFFIGFIGLTALRAGGFSPPFYCPTACGGEDGASAPKGAGPQDPQVV